MWRRAANGKQWFSGLRPDSAQPEPDATIFILGAVVAASAVLLLEADQLRASEHNERTRDADLAQLEDTEYLPGPRCLDRASNAVGASEISRVDAATAAGAP